MEAYKDLLQMGFSFFVAAYLLIVFNQTITMLSKKIDELITETKHFNALLMTIIDQNRQGGIPHQG